MTATRPSPARAGESTSGGSRLTSLDGLRGLAALIVVVHHCALTLPALADQNQGPHRGESGWWLTYSPLHLVWAGGEAVLVFFVLSGLVLALPHMRDPKPGTWLPYYLKRVVRLYLPVVVAVVVTGVVVTLVPRVSDPAHSWWANAHAVTPRPGLLLHDAGLLGGTGWLNSALWSLRYEVFFSIFLPVFVTLARRLTAPLWATVPMTLWGIGWAASISHELLSYLFVFAVGVLIAQRLPTLREWGARVDQLRWSGPAWALIGVAGVLLLLSEWWMKAYVQDWTLWLPVGRPGGVLGAAVLVFCVLNCRSARAVADSRVLQWLGKVSFSLYLVHEPLVVSVATLAPAGTRGLAVTLVVGVTVSLVAAVLFFHVVERPSQRVSAWVGRAVRRVVAPASPSASPARAEAAAGTEVPAPVAVPGPRHSAPALRGATLREPSFAGSPATVSAGGSHVREPATLARPRIPLPAVASPAGRGAQPARTIPRPARTPAPATSAGGMA